MENRNYAAPTVVVVGTVQELTQGSGAKANDPSPNLGRVS